MCYIVILITYDKLYLSIQLKCPTMFYYLFSKAMVDNNKRKDNFTNTWKKYVSKFKSRKKNLDKLFVFQYSLSVKKYPMIHLVNRISLTIICIIIYRIWPNNLVFTTVLSAIFQDTSFLWLRSNVEKQKAWSSSEWILNTK